jgi:hypothetical protein
MKNFPFNFPGTIVEIEIFADVLYYIIYGKYSIIQKFKDILNEHSEKNNIDKKYIIAKLNLPVAKLCDMQEKVVKTKNMVFHKSLETIQCLVYADCTNKDAKNMYALLCLEKNPTTNSYELKYPSLDLDDNFDPEEIIYKELKKVSPYYAKYIKRNLKLVDIAGDEDEILVYSCKIVEPIIKTQIKIK